MITKTDETTPKTETTELAHRTPWRFFEEVRDEMEELWHARNRPAFPHFPKLVGRDATAWLPSTDVYRTNGNLIVKADLPGLKKDDVEVRVENGFLIVKGERREEREEKEKEYYRSECSYGSFYRRIPLPAEVDPDQISAKVHDGVLEVTVPIPATESPQAKTIPIS
jgi:HSP20 family protein